jgi:Ca-activated chloride channel family protein
MSFAKPQFLLLLLLLPACGLFFAWANQRRQTAVNRLGDAALIDRLSAGVNWNGRRWQTSLWFMALAFFAMALARPQWGSEVQVVEQEGLQVMVALDVSQSMLAQDLKPNRLERAKLEISDLMDQLNGDEIGLALFSGASFIQFPLTSDYATARFYLDSARPGVISRPGTVIGEAIQTALGGFDESLASQKVLIIMTDGEDHETDPLAVAQQAADADVLIYTIGFGTPEGEPIPELDAQGEIVSYKQDQNGQTVLSKLDEVTLQKVAAAGNGRYYRATPDGSELANLLAELGRLQKAALENRFETKQIERFQIFLAVALAALVASELIPDRVTERASRKWRLPGLRRPQSAPTEVYHA